MPASDPQRAIDAIWRIESAKLIAGLTRITRDLAVAEELAQDALVAALEQWPREGVPANPGAWLMAAGKHRAIDRLRRRTSLERKHEEVAREQQEREQVVPDLDAALDDVVRDDVLRLLFIACHPVLSTEARVALTLRLLVPFEVPRGAELDERLSSVLEVIYLVFNEGYSATSGDDWLRPALCEDALRLGRILVGLVPEQAEAHGLLALMELQASRSAARVGPNGEPVLLLEQHRDRWDQLSIRRGLAALERVRELGGAEGPYALQAAIAACHARASTADATEWPRIAALYELLLEFSPSPVVALNRAVAFGMAFGAAVGLEELDALRSEPRLAEYHLLWSARGDLLWKLGRYDEARQQFARSAALTRNDRERKLLLERAAAAEPNQ